MCEHLCKNEGSYKTTHLKMCQFLSEQKTITIKLRGNSCRNTSMPTHFEQRIWNPQLLKTYIKY